MAAFECRQAVEIRDVFARFSVRYLFLGKSGAVLLGLPDTTQDVDLQLKNGPFNLDLVFAPDGLERFEDSWRRRVDVEGFPVCHIDDIIASKAATNRQKDRESLPRLRAFREYWIEKHR